MKQESFSDMEYRCRKKKTKREEFLEIMDEIIPWEEWVSLVVPHYPTGKRGRPPIEIETMLGDPVFIEERALQTGRRERGNVVPLRKERTPVTGVQHGGAHQAFDIPSHLPKRLYETFTSSPTFG